MRSIINLELDGLSENKTKFCNHGVLTEETSIEKK